jgi:hypothetical protein
MLIYTTHDTPRFRYAVDVLLGGICAELIITVDADVFQHHAGAKMAYCLRQFNDAWSVPVIGVPVWRGGTVKHDVSKGQWMDMPTLYPGAGDIPFDVFAATFFLVSRYEEYWPFQGDSMGRFASLHSVVGEATYLQRPLIDEWRGAIFQMIRAKWPTEILLEPSYRLYSTIDVDSAFAYVGKGITRTCAGMAKDVLHRKWPNLKYRLLTILGMRADKYDTYAYIDSILSRYRCQHIYFFQLSDLAEFDRNVRYTSKALRNIIRQLSREYAVGIHPGVRSNFKPQLLDQEKVRLENIIGDDVTQSRQHYLYLRFPSTYQELLRVGIREDFTMGYADAIGFRAGTSLPFQWFDLEIDRVTDLKVYPIAMMDTTLHKYVKLKPTEAMHAGRALIDRVRMAKGQCMILWHNESLSESDGWEGWRTVWEDQLQYGNALS